MAKKVFTLDDMIAAHEMQTGMKQDKPGSKTAGNSGVNSDGSVAEGTEEVPDAGSKAGVKGTAKKEESWQPSEFDMMGFDKTMESVNNAIGDTQRTLNRIDRNAKKAKNPLDVGRIELGKSRKVERKEKLGLNGEKQVSYVNESGNEYDNETMAMLDQQAIDKEKAYKLDPIGTELKDAIQEREELMRRLQQRSDELAKESDESLLGQVARGVENQLMMLGMGGTGNMKGKGTRLSDMTDKEYRDLTTALNMNNDRILALKAQRDKAGTEFWRNFGDTFKRSGTWTFGFSDAIDAINLSMSGNAKDERERVGEQKMFEQTLKRDVAQSEYEKTRNWVGNGGIITANMIPFALEMASGAGIFTKMGEAGARLMTRVAGNAIKNNAAKWTLKTLGKLGGYYAGSAVVANTAGIGGTIANIGQRYAGEIDIKKDENGNYVYDDNGRLVYEQKKGDVAKSIYQGEVSSIREFFTEKALEPLMLGKGISKGMEKIGLKKITDGLTAFGNVPFVKTMRNWMNRAGLSNYPEEGMEEELGIIMGSIDGTGDNKLSDLWDKDQQLDIWGGMAFSMGALGAVQLGAGARGYMKYNTKLKKADREASYNIDNWDEVRERIDNSDNNNILGVMREYMESDYIPKKDKHLVMSYANALMQFRGFNNASEGIKEDEVENGNSRKANTDTAMDAAYMQGYSADDNTLKDIRARYELTRQKLQGMLGEGVDIDKEVIDGRSAYEVIEDLESRVDEEGNPLFTEEERVSVLDYMKAKSAWDGMTDGVRDSIEDAAVTARSEISEKTNTDDWMIWSGKTKTDKEIFVTQGRVALREDGSIDTDLSDDTIIVYYPETGKRKMVDLDSIQELKSPVDADQLMNESVDRISKEMNSRYSSLINGKIIPEQGKTYDLIDGSGNVAKATILQKNEDGNYIVKYDGEEQAYIATEDQLQESYNEANALRLQQSIDERRMDMALRRAKAMTEMEEGQDVKPEEFVNGADMNNDGSDINNDGFGIGENSNAGKNYSYGDVVEMVINGQKTNGTVNSINDDGRLELIVADETGNERVMSLTQDELSSYTANQQQAGANDQQAGAYQQQAGANEQQADANEQENAVNTDGAQETSALSRIPTLLDGKGKPVVNKKGKPMLAWEQAPVEDTVSALSEINGGVLVEVRDTAQAMKEKADELLTKAKQKKATGDDPIEIAESKMQNRKAVEAAQSKVDYWKGVVLNVQNKMLNSEREAAALKEAQLTPEEIAERERQKAIESEQRQAEAKKRAEEEAAASRKEREQRARYAPMEKAKKELSNDPEAMELLSNTEPRDIDEYVAMEIPSYKFLWNDIDEGGSKITGLQSELGYSFKDMQKYINIIGTREKGGKPFNWICNRIYEDMPEGMKNKYDDTDVRNAVLDVLHRSEGTKDLWHYVQDKRIAEARNLVKQKEEQLWQQEMDTYVMEMGMSEDEAESYAELSRMPVEYVPDEALAAINDMIINREEEMAEYLDFIDQNIRENEQSRRSEEMGGEPEQGRVLSAGEASEAGMRGAAAASEENNDVAGAEGSEAVQSESVVAGGAVDERAQVDADIKKSIEDFISESAHDVQITNYDEKEYEAHISVDGKPSNIVVVPPMELNEGIHAEYRPDGGVSNPTQQQYQELGDALDNYNKTASRKMRGFDGEHLAAIFSSVDAAITFENWINSSVKRQADKNGGELIMLSPRNKVESLSTPHTGSSSDGKVTQKTATKQEKSGKSAKNDVDSINNHDLKQYKREEDPAAKQQGTVANNVATGNANSNKNVGDKVYGADNAIVSRERYEELKKRMRMKLGGQLNSGFDPEVLVLGVEMAAYHIEAGARKFTDFARNMIADMGDNIRPYLKAFYNGARDMPEIEAAGYASEMTPYDEVRVFDVNAFDKKSKKSFAERLSEAKAETDTNPSEAQKIAGNYKKGHLKVDGYEISIENPKGSVRSGVDPNGERWSVTMNDTYGYIGKKYGADGDHLDVYLNDNADLDNFNGSIYVIDLYKDSKGEEFDEHKIMWGYDSRKDARESFLKNYDDQWAKEHLIIVTGIGTKDGFKRWMDSSKTKRKPFNEIVYPYRSVKEKEAEQTGKKETAKGQATKLPGTVADDKKGSEGNDLVGKIFTWKKHPKNNYYVSMIIPSGIDKGFVSLLTIKDGDIILRGKHTVAAIRRLIAGGKLVETDKAVSAENAATIERVRDENARGSEISRRENYLRLDAARKNKDIVDAIVEDAEKEQLAGDDGNVAVEEIKQVKDVLDKETKKLEKKEAEYKEEKEQLAGISENAQKSNEEDSKGNKAIDDNKPVIWKVDGKKHFIVMSVTNVGFDGKEVSVSYMLDNYQTVPADELTQEDEIDSSAAKQPRTVADDQKTEESGTVADDQNTEESAMVADKGGREPSTIEKKAIEIAEKDKNAREIEKRREIVRKKQKKDVSLQHPMQGDLFASATDNINNNKNERYGLQGNDESGTSRVPAKGNDESEQTGRLGKTPGEEGRGSDRVGERSRAPKLGARMQQSLRLDGELKDRNKRNNRGERGISYAPSGVDARISANIAAIETANRLIDNDAEATPEDMKVLRRFSGWGGLGKAFIDGSSTDKKLRELLGEEAYDIAQLSRNSSFYTPIPVVDNIWDAVRRLGFKGGNILEGSAGIGNMLQQMPEDISSKSSIHAVELEQATGNILKLLYPDAKVEIQGFQDTKVANGSIDLAITNVPFVPGLHVNDTTGDKDLSKKFKDIHDYCIAKNIRKLRQGGIGVFITTKSSLDNSDKLRSWITGEGQTDVIGAFRLNKNTFGGADATSDIIIVRKRVNGIKSPNAIDVSDVSTERSVTYYDEDGNARPISIRYNKYFIDHPENMGGKMYAGFERKDTYRPTSVALFAENSIDQQKELERWANGFEDMSLKDGMSENVLDEQLNDIHELAGNIKEGAMVLNEKGEFCVSQFGMLVPLNINDKNVRGKSKKECYSDYLKVKDALDKALSYQMENDTDDGLGYVLNQLNDAYDTFVKKYGHFNKNTSISFLKNDIDFPSVAALEDVKANPEANGSPAAKQRGTVAENGATAGGKKRKGSRWLYKKSDVFEKRVVSKEKEQKPTSVKDGVTISLYRSGRIDVPFIADSLGISDDDVVKEITKSGLGYEDPMTREMVVSYEYLSGNVREKLRQAKENNDGGKYDINIKALEKVQPMNIPAHLIEFTLGSSWVPPTLFEDFVKEKTDLEVKLKNVGGTWYMHLPSGTTSPKDEAMSVKSQMCDKMILGHTLIEAAMQNKSITVSKVQRHSDGSTETITDKDATQACATKIDELKEEFKEWSSQRLQNDESLANKMSEEYNDKFNNYVPKEVPMDFIPEHYGGANTNVKLYSYQSKAVAIATTQPTLLAHEVGTGKTFTLISIAMEMRRLGTAKKPMVVVQNATVGQFAASAKYLYPNAKILTIEDRDKTKAGRRAFYSKIRYNDWDMVIIPQSVLERIPDSEERQARYIESKIEEKMAILEQMRESTDSSSSFIVRAAEKEIKELQTEQAELRAAGASKKAERDKKREAMAKENAGVKAREMLDRAVDDVENFDDMGIDALLVDEAHEYKHLGFATAMQRGVKGIDPSYSKKSQGVYLKAQSVLEKNHGKNVVFATGTPISNTAAEIWTFMRYLMPAETMKEYGIYYFDDFVRNFGDLKQMMEFATSGQYKEVNRFAGYVNLPEMIRIWSSITDTVLSSEVEDLKSKIPELSGGKAEDVFLPQSKTLRSIMKAVKKELQQFDEMDGKEKRRNSHIPLTMFGIAKAAAVDCRLVMADAPDEPNSKTNACVKRTLEALKESESYKGTVAIFADNYKNDKTGFNVYEDIKSKLISSGVPEEQIVIMKSGMSVNKKVEIFDKANAGDIRVLLGSTFTLGTGVNIQERLFTLIHLDAPNRPMDYTQRNGRELRQGNLHKKWGIPVHIVRFGVEDSLDVTAYQRLKTKGAIADSIMHGKKLLENNMENRVIEEEEDVFGDAVAQLSGSQFALLKNKAEKEVRKYEVKYKQWKADQTYVANRLRWIDNDALYYEDKIAQNKKYLEKLSKSNNSGIEAGGTTYKDVASMEEYIKEYNKKSKEFEQKVRDSLGDKSELQTLRIKVSGFTFDINTTYSKESVFVNGTAKTVVTRGMSISCDALGVTLRGVKQSLLKNALNDIVENIVSGRMFEERINESVFHIEKTQREKETISERLGKPFEFSEELTSARNRLDEFEAKMQEELAEKEAKYAAMDAEVDAATDMTESTEATEADAESTEDETMYRDGEEHESDSSATKSPRTVADVNEVFNEELSLYEKRELPSGHRFDLGYPSKYLLSSGFENLPISMRSSLLSRKAGDEKHPFKSSDLKDLVKELQKPIAIFHYSKENMRNIIVATQSNGKHFLIGMTLNYNANGIEINSVSGLFPKESHEWIKWIQDGKAIRIDSKEKVQDLIASLRTNPAESARIGLNLESVAKIVKEFENPTILGENSEELNSNEEEQTMFRLREDAAPEKTGIGYKVFVLKDGKLYPPMVANPNGADTPVGVWLDADAAPVSGMSKTGRPQVKAGGKGTQGGSGQLAYRPGWHLGTIPYALQFNRKNPVTGEKELFPKNFVWAEVEYANDIDYQKEAYKEGINSSGKYQHSLAGLKRLPVNGSYMYRTNPDPRTDPWIITGAMKINRILMPSEVDNIVRAAGRKPQPREDGAITNEQIMELNKQLEERDDMSRLTFDDDKPRHIEISFDSRFGWSCDEISGYWDSKEKMLDQYRNDHPDEAAFIDESGRYIVTRKWMRGNVRSNGREGSATRLQRTEALSREHARMRRAAEEMAKSWERLGVKVEIVDSVEGLTGRRAKAKGWFSPKNNTVTVVLPNHYSTWDVKKTVMHEVIGHYGLRELVGRENMDTFLDNLYNAADENLKKRIDKLAEKYKGNTRVATEEYLARIAEDMNFETEKDRTWWSKVRRAIINLLKKAGVNLRGITISEADARYIVWRSWRKLTQEGAEMNIVEKAEDISMQAKMGVGDYAAEVATFEARAEKDQAAKQSGTLTDEDVADETEYYRMVSDVEKDMAKHLYEQSVATYKFKSQMAWQDSMLGLKKLQEAIAKGSGMKIEDWQDAYKAENRMSSKNYAEMEAYRETFYKDLIDAVKELTEDVGSSMSGKNGSKKARYQQLIDYMNAKHGIERNVVLAFRDAIAADYETPKEQVEALDAYNNMPEHLNNVERLRNGDISYREYIREEDRLRKGFTESYESKRERDYSGLTELTEDFVQPTEIEVDGNKESVVLQTDIEAAAWDMVREFEAGYEEGCARLWDAVNAATKASLTKLWESGMMDKKKYEGTKNMFEYYIPLRGFSETTSDEVYNYLLGWNGIGAKVEQTAKGRKSKADDPIATIGNMAERSIMEGNRNLMKQHFLKLVMTHPTDAVSINEVIIHKPAGSDSWEMVPMPDLKDTESIDKVVEVLDKYNFDTDYMLMTYPDAYKRARENPEIPYKVIGKNLNEHQVAVKMLGKDYVLTINGNPVAAQALNGLTNPDTADNILFNTLAKTMRWMSMMFTQKNPAFLISNLSRDAFFANSMVRLKEGKGYSRQFTKNWGKALVNLGRLIRKQKNGTLDMDNPLEKMFHDFVMNGGETGYTFLRDVEAYKDYIAKTLTDSQRSGWNPKKWVMLLNDMIDYLGRWTEDTSRFAAYMTSRETGRTIERSISDAKEITVNFNKKGSGSKYIKYDDKSSFWKNSALELAQYCRNLYIFFNAGVQGMFNVGKAAAKNKRGALKMGAIYTAAGVLLPIFASAIVAALGGDDEDDYYNLPEYVRRSNLCIWVGYWVCIPLPIEMRACYGIGEILAGQSMGKTNYTLQESLWKTFEQLSQVLPIDLAEGGGSMMAFVPSQIKPIAEAYGTLKDWTGLPIYKNNDFNKYMPEWTKAYNGTNKELVWLTSVLNEWSGGDKYTKGWLDLNPATIEHLAEGYLGGVGKVINQSYKTVSMAWDEDMREVRNVPIINSYIKGTDERTRGRSVSEKYYNYLKEYHDTERRYRGYMKEEKLGSLEYAKKLDDLLYSREYCDYEIMKDYKETIDKLRKEKAETTDKVEQKRLDAAIRDLMIECVEILEDE